MAEQVIVTRKLCNELGKALCGHLKVSSVTFSVTCCADQGSIPVFDLEVRSANGEISFHNARVPNGIFAKPEIHDGFLAAKMLRHENLRESATADYDVWGYPMVA